MDLVWHDWSTVLPTLYIQNCPVLPAWLMAGELTLLNIVVQPNLVISFIKSSTKYLEYDLLFSSSKWDYRISYPGLAELLITILNKYK